MPVSSFVTGFVSGHGFSHAIRDTNKDGLQLLLLAQLVPLPFHPTIPGHEGNQISAVDDPRRDIRGKQKFHSVHRELRLNGMLALTGLPAPTIDSIA